MKLFKLVIQISLLVFMLAGCSTPPLFAPIRTPTPTDQPAYNFTLASLQGNTITLNDLRGRWVILNFWATWCVPCRQEMPYLQQVSDEYADRVTVLGVNMREEPDDIQPFVDELGLTFSILLHPDDEMLLWYGPRGLPLTYVVTPAGAVAYHQFGPLEPKTFDEWLTTYIQHSITR